MAKPLQDEGGGTQWPLYWVIVGFPIAATASTGKFDNGGNRQGKSTEGGWGNCGWGAFISEGWLHARVFRVDIRGSRNENLKNAVEDRPEKRRGTIHASGYSDRLLCAPPISVLTLRKQ